MRSIVSLVAFLGIAGAAGAQQPPRPPAPPAPAPRPAPSIRPAPAPAAEFWARGIEAEARVAMERARESMEYARQSLEFAPLDFPTWSSRDFARETLAPLAFERAYFDAAGWSPQDPADSLYRVAYEAMNRGDWRRSADLFAQVQSRYPRSNRLVSAAYYEAFANYRIGSDESLRNALRILTERTKGATQSSTQAEIASLTTRVRGALAARGDRDAQNQLQRDAQQGRACDKEDIQVRTEALSALASADMASATPMLRRVLERRDECSLELRRRALSILLRRADTTATSAAIAVARSSDENVTMRTDAITYLSRLPGDNAIATLQELLRTSQDVAIQRAAIRSLSRSDNVRARQSVRALLERTDVSEQLRSEALSSFDERSSADDAAYLRSLYPKLQGERLRSAAITAIARVGGEENERYLLAIAGNRNESSETRAAAIGRMTGMKGIGIAEWQRLYDAAESRPIRARIIGVYGRRTEPEATDRLIDIVRNGTDPSLRSSAISALKAKNDPRARKLLQDMVDRVDR